MLLVVVLATLTQFSVVSTQDVSRLCLTRALLVGHLTISPCVGASLDHARFHGRIYSDKAPGLSFLALPAAAAAGQPGRYRPGFHHDLSVWLVRVLTNGVAFLLITFALGRVAEGIAAGSGGPVAVTFALGTTAGALAATMFDQVAAAAFCFGAFALAWRRRPSAAGLLAGTAVLVEYQTAPIVAIVGLYVAATGARPLARFAAAAAPPLLLLGAYDWAAFGSPLHASYRYVANGYAEAQSRGFFGISLPAWRAVSRALGGDRGLLVTSPVLVAAALGLILLARSYRREAIVCAAVTSVGLLLEFGYFLPYGGVSPGPRFFVPALPFLALGLAPMFARARAATSALMIASLIASTAVLLTWSNESVVGYRETVWGELARALTHTHSRLRTNLTKNLLAWVGVGHVVSAAVVAACVAGAGALTLCPVLRPRAANVPEPDRFRGELEPAAAGSEAGTI